MKCPKCGSFDGRVVDSRLSKEGESIRRRRECNACGHRFTTYETIEAQDLRVIKSDGRYQPFDKQKLLAGISKACEKRPVRAERVEAVVIQILAELEREYERDIPTRAIGEKIMNHLRQLDHVAYVRFASVYRRFQDVEAFAEEIERLRDPGSAGGAERSHEGGDGEGAGSEAGGER